MCMNEWWRCEKQTKSFCVFDDQLYAPTTLAPARDFWLLRYTSVLEDGSLVVSGYWTLEVHDWSNIVADNKYLMCAISSPTFILHSSLIPQWHLHHSYNASLLQICERSLKNTQNGPTMPPVQHFVRAEMLPSGYLIRPCEGGGSIIHIVDHMDLEVNKFQSVTLIIFI